MATKRTVLEEFTDDLDGGKAEGTVRFSYDGTDYEIDLSKKNKSAFDKVVKPYIDASRTVRKARSAAGRGRARGVAAKKTDTTAIREWASANGHEISSR